MRNRFKGKCYRCGEVVQAGEGHFEKLRQQNMIDGVWVNWRVQHALCAIKWRGFKQPPPLDVVNHPDNCMTKEDCGTCERCLWKQSQCPALENPE